ncbi:MAG: signal peptidase II [Caulobacteraceae bacterium]
MTRISRWGAMAYGLAISIVAADQAVKAWVVGGLRLRPGWSLDVWGPLRLTLVQNNGVSFGLFQSDAAWTRWGLALFSFVVAVVLALWARRAERPLTGVSVGLIMGGAVGNLIDRARFGSVVDFVDVQALHFPWVFNLADSAITVGVLLLLAENLWSPRKAAA